MAAFIDSAVLLLIVAGVCSIGAAVIDIDSPSPASQRLVSSHSNSDSSEMFSSSQKRPMETIDDLMNALAQVTKSKGKYHTVQSKQTNSYRKSSQSTLGYRWIRNRKNRIYCIHLSFQRLFWIFLVSLSFGRDVGGEDMRNSDGCGGDNVSPRCLSFNGDVVSLCFVCESLFCNSTPDKQLE